ncbi:MAG: hypothetical protein KBF88_00555 [Polyangiaceae bacterium]|nr:hypothetical protein [Polyangiaceae bacterium]
MSDPRDLNTLDWDAAIDEWEKSAFDSLRPPEGDGPTQVFDRAALQRSIEDLPTFVRMRSGESFGTEPATLERPVMEPDAATHELPSVPLLGDEGSGETVVNNPILQQAVEIIESLAWLSAENLSPEASSLSLYQLGALARYVQQHDHALNLSRKGRAYDSSFAAIYQHGVLDRSAQFSSQDLCSLPEELADEISLRFDVPERRASANKSLALLDAARAISANDASRLDAPVASLSPMFREGAERIFEEHAALLEDPEATSLGRVRHAFANERSDRLAEELSTMAQVEGLTAPIEVLRRTFRLDAETLATERLSRGLVGEEYDPALLSELPTRSREAFLLLSSAEQAFSPALDALRSFPRIDANDTSLEFRVAAHLATNWLSETEHLSASLTELGAGAPSLRLIRSLLSGTPEEKLSLVGPWLRSSSPRGLAAIAILREALGEPTPDANIGDHFDDTSSSNEFSTRLYRAALDVVDGTPVSFETLIELNEHTRALPFGECLWAIARAGQRDRLAWPRDLFAQSEEEAALAALTSDLLDGSSQSIRWTDLCRLYPNDAKLALLASLFSSEKVFSIPDADDASAISFLRAHQLAQDFARGSRALRLEGSEEPTALERGILDWNSFYSPLVDSDLQEDLQAGLKSDDVLHRAESIELSRLNESLRRVPFSQEWDRLLLNVLPYDIGATARTLRQSFSRDDATRAVLALLPSIESRERYGWLSLAGPVAHRETPAAKSLSVLFLRPAFHEALLADQFERTAQLSVSLQEGIETDLDRAFLSLRVGESHVRVGELDRAESFFESAEAYAPDLSIASFRRFSVAEELRGIFHARPHFEHFASKLVDRDNTYQAWIRLANTFEYVADAAQEEVALSHALPYARDRHEALERLARSYAKNEKHNELAALLEEMGGHAETPEARADLQVQRGNILAGTGNFEGATKAYAEALKEFPARRDWTQLLADSAERSNQWATAESALLSLLRAEGTPGDQAKLYERLGSLYQDKLDNPSRAEVCFLEVVKREPHADKSLEKLVDLYLARGEVDKAIEHHDARRNAASERSVRFARTFELSRLIEDHKGDLRSAERVLEELKKEYPRAIEPLRALFDFYKRQKQSVAAQLILDRTLLDLRRSIQGRSFSSELFEVLGAAHEMRSEFDAVDWVRGVRRAIVGDESGLFGSKKAAFTSAADEIIAPAPFQAAFRALLTTAGLPLEAIARPNVTNITVVPKHSVAAGRINDLARRVELPAIDVFVCRDFEYGCIALSSIKPSVIVGTEMEEEIMSDAATFLIVRALKAVASRLVPLLSLGESESTRIVRTWLTALNPDWKPEESIDEAARATLLRTPQWTNLQKTDAGFLALEVAGLLSSATDSASLAAHHWINRTALLWTGNLHAAFTALAWAEGRREAPTEPMERRTWIEGHPEAADLVAFASSDECLRARKLTG